MSNILSDRKTLWEKRRSEIVTATDAADLICWATGNDYYNAPATLLAMKRGAHVVEGSEVMAWGHRLQQVIGDAYAEKTGRFIQHFPEYTLHEHPSIPWLAASPDADQVRALAVEPLEIKSDGSKWEGEKGQEAPPFRHVVQTQLQIACRETPTSGGTVCAFVNRWRPVLHVDIQADPDFLDASMPLLEEFYHYVRTGTLPTDPRWYDLSSTRAFWKRGHEGVTVALDRAEDLWLVNRWERARSLKKALGEEEDRCEAALAVRLGHAEVGTLNDGTSYTYKTQTRQPRFCPCGCGFQIQRGSEFRVGRRFIPQHLKQAIKLLSRKRTK